MFIGIWCASVIMSGIGVYVTYLTDILIFTEINAVCEWQIKNGAQFFAFARQHTYDL